MKEAMSQDKKKKKDRPKTEIIERASELLYTASYNTYTEQAHKEYREIALGLRKILREFYSQKQEAKQREKETINPPVEAALASGK